jgi:peptidoglycan biosynthesis protein MviN/MurJ (putative lipid II flippase)
LVIAIGTWQFNQVLLPSGEETLGLKLQLLIAILSLCFNFLLVPILSYIGSSIAILVTESIGTLIGVYIINSKYKYLYLKYITKSFMNYFIATIFMSIVIIIIRFSINSLVERLILSIFISPIVYYVSIIVLRDEIVIDLSKGIFSKILAKK